MLLSALQLYHVCWHGCDQCFWSLSWICWLCICPSWAGGMEMLAGCRSHHSLWQLRCSYYLITDDLELWGRIDGERGIEEKAPEGTGWFLLLSQFAVLSSLLSSQVLFICCGFTIHLLCTCRGQGWEHIVLPLPFLYPWIDILPAAGQIRKLSQGLEMAKTHPMTSWKKNKNLNWRCLFLFASPAKMMSVLNKW